MNKIVNIICIECPKGCHLQVSEDLVVSGYECNRGIIYGRNEATKPMRLIASTVKINSMTIKRLPVAVNNPIPKQYIFDIMKQIDKIVVNPPVKCRQSLIKNILNLGVDIISTRTILK